MTPTNAFIDDIEGSGYGVGPVEAAAAKLPAPDPTAAAITDVNVWIQEGLVLAQTKIYVAPIGDGDGPFIVTPAYQAALYALGQERIARGRAPSEFAESSARSALIREPGSPRHAPPRPSPVAGRRPPR